MESAHIRVLLVEDDPEDAEFAKRALSQANHSTFEVCWACEMDQAFERLGAGKYDVVVLDLGLPGCTGLESLQWLRDKHHEIPVVVLTGVRDEKMAVVAMENGAQDYLVKGNLSADVLTRSIRYAIQRQQLLVTTAQHEFELAARLNLAQIVESSDDAIESETLEGVITSWNQGAERIFGYSKEEVLGQNVAVFVPPERADELQQILTAVRAGKSIKHLDTDRVRKDGRRIHVSLSISPIKDLNGRITGISEIARDITERKRVKDVLERQSSDLTRVNADLEKVNRDLKQFAYAASHDLKEPLRMVTSYCQLLNLECSDQLDANGLNYLRFASDGARRMHRLVDDLLSFSNVTDTSEPAELVGLDEALSDALLNLQTAIQESGARVEAEPLPIVDGHRALFATLFQNLIGNSIKFRRNSRR